MAMTSEDTALLTRFFRDADHAAFNEVMQRHLPAVYSAALRITGQREMASDVAQDVFLRLSQNPLALMKGIPLSAWLHRTTRNRALDVIRSERRRANREKTVVPEPADDGLAPGTLALLDEVIDKLPAGDRAIILDRFMGNHSFGVISERLNLSEDAARMRVGRALEKMRKLLARRGVMTSAALLASGLGASAASVPPQLSTGILTLVKNAPPVSKGLVALILMTTYQKLLVGAAAVLILSSATVMVVKKTHADDASSGAGAAASGDTAAGADKKAKSKTGETAKRDPLADFPDLVAKYGADRTRESLVLFTQATDLARQGESIERKALAGDVRKQMHSLDALLELDDSQKALLDSMLPAYTKAAQEAFKTYDGGNREDRQNAMETMLAADALASGGIDSEEFGKILSRTAKADAGGKMTTLFGSAMIAEVEHPSDPLEDLPDEAARFTASLRPDQKTKYDALLESARAYKAGPPRFVFNLDGGEENAGASLKEVRKHLKEMKAVAGLFENAVPDE